MKRSYHYSILVLIALVLIILGQVFGKIAANEIVDSGIMGFGKGTIFLAISYSCLILQGLVWIFVVRKFELTFVYPLMSFAYVLILIMSVWFFKEQLTLFKIIGTVTITIGVSMISFKGGKKLID